MTTEGMQAMQPHLRQMMADANSQIEKMVKEQLQEKKQDHTVKPDTVKN